MKIFKIIVLLMMCLMGCLTTQAQHKMDDSEDKTDHPLITREQWAQHQYDADRRVLIQFDHPLKLKGTDAFIKGFQSKLRDSIEDGVGFKIVRESVADHWLRVAVAYDQNVNTEAFEPLFLAAWKSEARWGVKVSFIPQSNGISIDISLYDALTGRALFRSREVIVNDVARDALITRLSDAISSGFEKRKTGRLIVVDDLVESSRFLYPELQRSWENFVRRALDQPGLIVLESGMSKAIARERKMFMFSKEIDDPYWTRPQRPVTVIRADLWNAEQVGLEMKKDSKIRLVTWLETEKTVQKYERVGEWGQLASLEKELINELYTTFRAEGWTELLDQARLKHVTKTREMEWAVWQQLLDQNNGLKHDKAISIFIETLEHISLDYELIKAMHDAFNQIEVPEGKNSFYGQVLLMDHLLSILPMGEQWWEYAGKYERAKEYVDENFQISLKYRGDRLREQIWDDHAVMYMVRTDAINETEAINLIFATGENSVAYDMMLRLLAHRHLHLVRPFIIEALHRNETGLAVSVLMAAKQNYAQRFQTEVYDISLSIALKQAGLERVAEEIRDPWLVHDQDMLAVEAKYYQSPKERPDFFPMHPLKPDRTIPLAGDVMAISPGADVWLTRAGDGSARSLYWPAHNRTLSIKNLSLGSDHHSASSHQIAKHADSTYVMEHGFGFYRVSEKGEVSVIEDDVFKDHELHDLISIDDALYVLATNAEVKKTILRLVDDQWERLVDFDGDDDVRFFLQAIKPGHVTLAAEDKDVLFHFDPQKKKLHREPLDQVRHLNTKTILKTAKGYWFLGGGNDLYFADHQFNAVREVYGADMESLRIYGRYYTYLRDHEVFDDKQLYLPSQAQFGSIAVVGDQLWSLDRADTLTGTVNGMKSVGPFDFKDQKIRGMVGRDDGLYLYTDDEILFFSASSLKGMMADEKYSRDLKTLKHTLKAGVQEWINARPLPEQIYFHHALIDRQKVARLLMQTDIMHTKVGRIFLVNRLHEFGMTEQALKYMSHEEQLLHLRKTEEEEVLLEQLRLKEEWQLFHDTIPVLWKHCKLDITSIPIEDRNRLYLWSFRELYGKEAYRKQMWRILHGDYPDAKFEWDNELFMTRSLVNYTAERLYDSLSAGFDLKGMVFHPLFGLDYDSNPEWYQVITTEAVYEVIPSTGENTISKSKAYLYLGQAEKVFTLKLSDQSESPWNKRTLAESQMYAAAYLGDWKKYEKAFEAFQKYWKKDDDSESMDDPLSDLNGFMLRIHCLRENEKAAAKYMQAQYLLNQDKRAQAIPGFIRTWQTAPNSLAGAEAAFNVAELKWLGEGDIQAAWQWFRRAKKSYQKLLMHDDIDVANWSRFQLGLISYVFEHDAISARQYWDIENRDGVTWKYSLHAMTSLNKAKPAWAIGSEDNPLKRRISTNNLEKENRRINPGKQIGNKDFEYERSNRGWIEEAFWPWEDEYWEESWGYNYYKEKETRPNIGWFYMEKDGVKDWVWLLHYEPEPAVVQMLKGYLAEPAPYIEEE